jgi:peptidoglycan/xylan/chitin deacetylase (PgdA/CDA1 family)
MRSFALSAVALAVLYVSCADPPKKARNNAGAGTMAAGSSQGSSTSGGSTQGDGGDEPSAGVGNVDPVGGSGGTSAGSGGSTAAEGGGEAGMGGGVAGEAGAGGEGPAPVDRCAGVEVGVASSILAPPLSTGVPKPSGAVGNLKVVNWAGFKGAISFTFDDALQSQIAHYDELNAVGVPMTFFLVGANDGSKPIWTTAALDGHELGNHTMHHCMANGTSCGWGTFTGIDAELDVCTEHMKTAFGLPGVYSFASPMGDANWVAAASARFIVGRGVWDDATGVVPNVDRNPFDLPCHIANKDEKADGGFNIITDAARTKGIWRIILAHALSANDGYNPIDAAEMVAAMTYARDAKDVWVDTFTTIGAYWRAQKAVSGATPSIDGASRTYSWTLPANFPPGQFLRVTVDGGTPTQCGTALTWDDHGYYEIALDAGSVTISP